MNKTYLFCVLFVFIGLFESVAQVPYKQKTDGEIILALQKLQVLGSVLYVAAHPDDENTRLLSYLSRGKKYRTAYLSLTRGDGGQNLIGGELGEGLGAIRTEELIEARKIDGAEQYFSRAIDFGYSKSPTETIETWGENNILEDIVWIIRKFRPDIIITRFPTQGKSHGHHIASAILTSKAFEMAGNPKIFRHQLKYVEVWEAKSLYWNTYKFGRVNTTSSEQTHFDVGRFNKYLGKSYGEIASESRSMHKSQGFGVSAYRDSRIEYLKHLKGIKGSIKDPFSHIPTELSSVSPELENIHTHFRMAEKNYRAGKTQFSVRRLFEARELLKVENKKGIYDKKISEINDIILSISGLWVESIADKSVTTHGDTLKIKSSLILRNSKIKANLKKIAYKGKKDTLINAKLEPFTNLEHDLHIFINPSTKFSNPYWLEQKHEKGYYNVKNYKLRGLPKAPHRMYFLYTIDFDGYSLEFVSPVLYKWADRVEGERFTNVHILPPAGIKFDRQKYFPELKETHFKIHLTSHADSIKGTLRPIPPLGFSVRPEKLDVNIDRKGVENDYHFLLVKDENITASKVGYLKAELEINDKKYRESIQKISYPHISTNYIVKEAKAEIPYFKLIKSKNILGYVDGAGDKVDETLQQLGYSVEKLSETDISSSKLEKYKAIILGIRAHNTNSWLAKWNYKLLDYVKNGGVLIVQYNTHNYLSRVNYLIGPYPFKISRNRVSDESSTVHINLPEDRLFNSPNKIEEDDWLGWVQERGIYFADEVDANYHDFLQMNDPGESPLGGSLIGGQYGRGYFFYTGISFFRQLPAGVEGAYKLFINMIEYKN